MPVNSSGAISLNDFHVEAGGSSGSQCSLNDSDIRGLINKNANSQMSFNEWYGASAILWTISLSAGSSSSKTGTTTGYMSGIGSVSDNTVDFLGGATLNRLLHSNSIINPTTGNAISAVYFRVSGSHSNSGWTQFTVGGTTFSRASASNYSNFGSETQWYWLAGNPFSGTQTIVFE